MAGFKKIGEVDHRTPEGQAKIAQAKAFVKSYNTGGGKKLSFITRDRLGAKNPRAAEFYTAKKKLYGKSNKVLGDIAASKALYLKVHEGTIEDFEGEVFEQVVSESADEHNGGYMLTKKHPRSGQTGSTTVYRHPESGHEIHVETHGSKYPPSFWSLKPSRHGLNIDGSEYTYHKSFTSAMKDGYQFEKGKFRPVKKSVTEARRVDPADEDDVYDPATGGDPEEHIVSQLHGAIGGNPIKFKDGTTHKIAASHARLALLSYSKIAKPEHRAAHAESLGAGRESFFSTINRKDPEPGAASLDSKNPRGRPVNKNSAHQATLKRRAEKKAAKAAGTTVTTSRDELLAPRRTPAGFKPTPPGRWPKKSKV